MEIYDLERFVSRQKTSFDLAMREIVRGKKESHWIWYIFPQLRALGKSYMSIYYGIADIDEAKAYMENEYLRKNLIDITNALLALGERDPKKIMGAVDAIKLCSSMTLFELAAPGVSEFGRVLDEFYGGERDQKTSALIKENFQSQKENDDI